MVIQHAESKIQNEKEIKIAILKITYSYLVTDPWIANSLYIIYPQFYLKILIESKTFYRTIE